MKKRWIFTLFFAVLFCAATAQYKVPLYTPGNSAGALTSADNNALVVVGQNASGLTTDNTNKVYLGLLGPVRYVLTNADMYRNKTFELLQNYPNPFKTNTTIPFEISLNSKVRLSVYNVLGQPVEIVTDKSYSAGKHRVNYNARKLTPGVYFYELKVGNYKATKPFVLTK